MKNKQILILYGSTGDLTFRKILPSLVNLEEQKLLDPQFLVLAIGRRDFKKEDYINFIKKHNDNFNLDLIERKIDYLKMEITIPEDYMILKNYLDEVSDENTRIIHFLAVAPNYMKSTVDNLVSNEIVQKNNINHSLVFEKPFGSNLVEAIKLNNMLEKRFSEEQIYRIDHYLGKGFVEKVMYYRFESNIFTSIFNNNSLKKIDIVLKEKDGILNRGSYFDNSGMVKDMFQGHVLQIITLLTMNKPVINKDKYIIKEKVKVLRKIKFKKENLFFGQYNNYLKEDNVDECSKTETMFRGVFTVNNNFKKVPIHVFTAKLMDKKETYVKLTLNDGSTIKLSLFPDSSIEIISKLKFNNINYKEVFEEKISDYGNVIKGIINYNKHLFVSSDEVILSWKIAEDVLKQKEELIIYNEDYDYES